MNTHFNTATTVLVSAFIFMLTACGNNEEKTEITIENEKFCLNETLKNQIKLDTIQSVNISQHINLTGEVNYNPDKVFNFSSLIEGFADRVLFSLGDYVQKGQLLAEIKSPELNSLWMEQKSLTTQIKVAERELSAVQSMFNDNLASERELVSAKGELDKLKTELQNINRNLSLYNPNPSKGTFEIKAPANGYIIDKNINPGMQITEGADLFTISGLDNVWVMANVYATDVQFVKQGMPVDIKILAYPNEVFHGKISMLSQVFDAEERVLKARIEIPNAATKLKPGMSADVQVEKQTNEQAFAIPVEDVIFDNNQNYIVLYKSDCEMEIKRIEISARNNDTYFVKEGIHEGEKIITKNQLLIYEKLK